MTKFSVSAAVNSSSLKTGTENRDFIGEFHVAFKNNS